MTGRPPSGVRRIFVDTSALYALADPRDGNHAAASAIITRVPDEPSQLFTTNFIVAEMHALILTRRGRYRALQALEELYRSSTTIVRVSAEDERQAIEILTRYQDKEVSFTDATSFVVMERLRIPLAFTFDHNFAQYGLMVLMPA